MAATHRFKVYTAEGEYVASVKSPELGAMLLSGACLGLGSTIRDGHSHIVWIEGVDGEAGESYDQVAHDVYSRIERRSFYSVSVYHAQLARYKRALAGADETERLARAIFGDAYAQTAEGE